MGGTALDRMTDSAISMSRDSESGYASGSSSTDSIPQISFTKPHLKFLNQQLSRLEPLDILRWAKNTLPSLYQTTAFGLTGLVTLDMLQNLEAEDPTASKIDLIFIDTLYHFKETHDLVDRVRAKYPAVNLHIYKPDGCDNVEAFEAKHGQKLWETNDQLYEWTSKIEPDQRAVDELCIGAVLTGRRRSQGAKRSDIGIIEVTDNGVVKLNPLYNWTFKQVQDYIKEHSVPYNALLDQGYKSVGDWHSTQPVAAGEDERAGRWKGQEKTECGIHNKRSKYAIFLMEAEAKRVREEGAKMKKQQEELTSALERVELVTVEA